jgi:hypothetical protein
MDTIRSTLSCHPAILPSCHPEGEGPATDSGEEMTLGVSHKLICCHILNTPFIDNTFGKMTGPH